MEQKRRIIPPVHFLLSLIAMTGLHFLAPVARIVKAPWSYAGGVVVVLGLALTAIAAGSFKRAGTPVVPFEPSTALVTSGLYRITRNPMYLGLVLALVGVAILLGTLTPFLPIPVFLWVIESQFIRGEERFLEELFGAEYLVYKRSVRRWF